MWKKIILFALCLGAVVGLYLYRGGQMLKPVQELRVRITAGTALPDPVLIQSTGDWYFLDHVSSGLAAFDSEKKNFVPLFAQSWSTDVNGAHIFKIKDGIKFHDGTPITAKDIVWSIKRHLIKRTSTHFPLWDYIVGCENLETLDQDCAGLGIKSEHEIAIKLKSQNESFFLQLASPETGIWWSGDIDAKTAVLKATKFSGPYYLAEQTDTSALLKRNENSPVSMEFKNSPRLIRLKKMPLVQTDEALLKNDVDLVVRPYRPLGERNWKSDGIQSYSTTKSSIIYFFGLGKGKRPSIGVDFIKALWEVNKDQVLSSAETYLPFTTSYGLKGSEFLNELPKTTAKKLRLITPEGFFTKDFIAQIELAAKMVGTSLEITYAKAPEFFAVFDDPKATEKHDYVLSSYAASERYPAVQLRYLTGNLVKPEIDLKKTEAPDLNEDRMNILRDYQKWLLKTNLAVPIYFNTTVFLYQKNIDIGAQPSSDAEIELWRVQEVQ